jgi:aspartyl-tRNA(Asn)/glutamyl-tRNA(Gln) amidotransferase subunit A
VRSQLDLGSLVPATMYLQAQRIRKVMRDAFREVFEKVDVIVGPALAGRPGPAGKFTTYIDSHEVDDRLVNPEYTGIYNLTGLPALAVPSGFGSDGTPIGIQIAGAWFDEATVFQVAHAYEQVTEWHKRRPPDLLPRT